MSKQIGVISGRVELDSIEFTKNLSAMKRELRTLKTDTELAKRGFDVFGDGITGSATTLKTFENSIKTNGAMMKRYSDDFDKAMKENDGQLTKASQNAQRNFKRMQLEIANTAEEYYKMALEQERADNQWYQGAKTLRDTGNQLKKTGKNVQDFGEKWTRVGIAVGLGAGAIMKTAIDFESGVVEMAKTIDTTESKFNELTTGVRELALEIPIAASELAELAATAGQFGIEEDSILNFTETVAGLSVATDLTTESAGMMVAQFAQITDMDHSNFDRLGSSVVELGNNLPTTESAIMNMAHGLAGAGHTAGMTQADIIGLAGGLSSLGISAERGSSSFSKLIVQMAVASATGVESMADLEAQSGYTRRELELMASNNSKGFKELADSMGMTTKEMNDVMKASVNLEGYASVAGVSVEEFARIFKEDAVGAIGMFVDGLANSNDETGTAIEILDELGISEIRLRDTLLRTGNAQGLLNDAVRESNKAWSDNTALAEEADLFYGSTASQMTILRNKVKDVAIELGTALLPVANDFIHSLDPMISGVKSAATWFTELDEGTQKLVASTIGLTIVGGPFVKLLGSGISVVGGLTAGVGSLGMSMFDAANKTRAAGKTWTMLKDTLGDLAGQGGFGNLVRRISGTTTATESMGGAVATASGSKGIGAMTGALKTLNPWLVGLVGVGGVLAVGTLAWKLWGKEAYNAGERTKRWGTDVGESTDSVLTDIESVTGKFGLMKQGISTDSESMIGDFKKIGNAINDDLNSRLEITEEYLAGLPETLRKSQQEILQTYQDNLNEALEITENNSAEIEAIHQRASDENRELTRDELEYIRSLQNQSLASYLSTLELSAEEEKAIRQALTGDIADTTREQGKQMLALLSQQEKGMADARKQGIDETHQYLKDNEISPDSKLGKELLDNTNRYHDALVVSNQRTMKELIDMYPELEKEVDLSTGRMINRQNMTQREYDEIITMNRILLDGWADSHRDVAKAAEDANSYIVDVTSEGAKAWNDVVLESGGNMDTFREKLIESTKETTAWNDIRLQLKNAELDSNAKLVIGEAAIMNGWWDGMAWEDKQAVLEDNFSETVYKAIEGTEAWNNLDEEEKFAVLTNGFTDTVIQGLIDIGKWNDMDVDEQQAIMTTNSPETLLQILDDLGVWERIDPEILELLLDNSPAKTVLNSTIRQLDDYGNIIEEATLKALDDTRPGVESARKRINSLPTSRTTTLTTRQVTRYEDYDMRSGYQRLYAQGTDFHVGGPAILGDGGRAEPFLTPQGAFGVSPATDTMYDLPRGTKVWSSMQNFATQLKSGANKLAGIQIPKFATGTIDFPNMQDVLKPFTVPNTFGVSNAQRANNVDSSGVQRTLEAILNALNNLNRGDVNIEKIEVQDGSDLRDTMEEMNWILEGEGNRLG